MARRSLPGVISDIFPHQRNQPYSSECQKNKAGYLQPELMHRAAKVAKGGPRAF